MAVSAHPEATAIGAAVLREGGNAADAACAMAWALAVCEPAESGLGGQATALVRDPHGGVHVIDGHSRAPRLASRGELRRRDQRIGVRATSVPTMPAAIAFLRQRFGTRSDRELIEPAASLADRGHRLTELQRTQIAWTKGHLAACRLASQRFLEGGAVPATGHRIRQPELAATLRRLAERGVEDFYVGETAAMILRDMVARNGLVGEADLAAVEIRMSEPLAMDWCGHRVLSVPPPGGGAQIMLALRLAGDAARTGARAPTEAERRRADAIRAAFRERERCPDHPDDLTPAVRAWLVSAERADVARAFLKLRPPSSGRDSMGEAGDTTHLCAADEHGMVVSLTQSIQSVFGAKTASPQAGFFYNNFLKTCPRGRHPYRLGPQSLPQSNAAPTLVLRRVGTSWSPALTLGAAGSRRLTTAIVQTIDGVIAHGLELPEAVRAPRLHALLERGAWVERPLLKALGRKNLERAYGPVRALARLSYRAGAAQAIAFRTGGDMLGVADPRRDGSAEGF